MASVQKRTTKDTTMNVRTRISKKHGAMQINLDALTFWFKGQWYNLSNPTIEYWMKELKGQDRVWFREALWS